MSLATPPPRPTRIAVVWPAGPSSLSVQAGPSSAAAASQATAPSRPGLEWQPKVMIKEDRWEEEEDEKTRRHAPYDVLTKDDVDGRTISACRSSRPTYYEDGRVPGGRIRKRRLSSPRAVAATIGTAASRQPKDYETCQIDNGENSELMDAILEDMGRLTVTMKMDDTGRWRILWKSRELDI